MPEAMRRPASLVSERAITQKVISPGLKVATPLARVINSQRGGRIDDTMTRFCCSISASRNAYSKAVKAWRCTPTPRVRNTDLGIGNMDQPRLFATSCGKRMARPLTHYPSPPRLPASPRNKDFRRSWAQYPCCKRRMVTCAAASGHFRPHGTGPISRRKPVSIMRSPPSPSLAHAASPRSPGLSRRPGLFLCDSRSRSGCVESRNCRVRKGACTGLRGETSANGAVRTGTADGAHGAPSPRTITNALPCAFAHPTWILGAVRRREAHVSAKSG